MISGQTLGLIELSVDGAPAPPELLWRKHLALLIYLARSPRSRSRDHLVALLWPEKPETAARHSLTAAVSLFRRYLGDSSVITEAGRLRLAPETVSLDLERLESLADSGEWEQAAELVRGDFLEGFSVPSAPGFDDWLEQERTAVRKRSVEVLINHAEQLIRWGRAPEAIPVAARALALDPTSEPSIQSLMKSLVLAGDRTGALEQFERFSARLRDELGTTPSAETRTLAERERQERWIRPVALGRRKEDSGLVRFTLVGREAELSQLLETARLAQANRHAAALLIEGDSGSGKTRLSEELLSRLRLDGVGVAAVRAVAADEEQEWGGVFALARSGLVNMPGVAAAHPSALAAFTERLGEWQDRFGSVRPNERPFSPGRALSEVLRAAADEQPVALAVDDAHWLDHASLLALIAMLRDLSSAPLLLVLAADLHPGRAELDEVRTHLGRDLHGDAVTLSNLDGNALRSLAQLMLPRYGDEEIERVVRRVALDSAGLPLLAVELFQAIAQGMDLQGTGGAWPEPLRTLDQTLPGDLPDVVVAAIRIGFRRLSHGAQQVLSQAAVLGDRISPELLSRIVGMAPEELSPILDELEWHRWLISETRGYGFVARVVRQVIAQDMLTPGQRQRVMEAAARVSGN
ncbi:MAG: BTAD domain-containing putative transcriptional regulator [Gemmatimonadales bacterium]